MKLPRNTTEAVACAGSPESIYKRNESSIWWCQYLLNGTRYHFSTLETDQAKALNFLANPLEGDI